MGWIKNGSMLTEPEHKEVQKEVFETLAKHGLSFGEAIYILTHAINELEFLQNICPLDTYERFRTNELVND